MSEKYEPFRLINCRELNELQQRVSQHLLLWNEQHALFPLSCHLSCNPHQPDQGYVLLTEHQEPIALLPEHYLSLIKSSLFGDPSDCFNTISETLLINLLNQLLGAQLIQQQSDTVHLDEWFYNGAPSLAMTLSGSGQSMTLYLHPHWVLNALPKHQLVQKPKDNLHEALEPQLLHWHVELNPVSLQLEDMIRLQVGDVIRTDHPLTTPLLLKNNQQTVCNVDIGETNLFKSIQITSSL